MSDIENKSLEAHVSICQHRYESLDQRLTGIEHRIERLENMVADIHHSIKTHNKGNTLEWIRARDALIAVLLGGLAFMGSKFLF